ncbi:MAG: homoserine dehydrogenase [Oscillospiraceae bacterium]|nr:homoserine dehydrogenase [Oscillospiraceae bacterium]
MKAAILGFGTVGVGVYEMLQAAPGLDVGLVFVRPGKDDAPFKTSELDRILSDPTIDAVVEVMGGVEPAYSYVSACLMAGKHVVSSNKALVAAHGLELEALAREKGVGFLFSAACGGAIPFLHNLALAVESDRIVSVGGILNGTTNFMLDAMQTDGSQYADVLRQAQQLGYAEADPSADVSGLDALRKIMLACAVAWGKLPVEGLLHEGIESLTAEDVAHFMGKGLVCRLLASASISENGKLCAFVQPMLFPAGAPETSVKKNFNLAKYHGVNSGDILLMGQGAGRYPTASAVLRDLSDIRSGRRAMFPAGLAAACADNAEVLCRYYVRTERKAAALFPFAEIEDDNVVVRGVTKPVSVKLMHETASRLRKDGMPIFFAALED